MPHDITALKYAILTAQNESFARAALEVGVKQTTLSTRIAALESRLGLQIFDRSVRGAALTDAGRQFIALAADTLADLDKLMTSGIALGAGRTGTLRLGFSGSLASGHLRAILAELLEHCPDIRIVGMEENRDELMQAIHRQSIDIAVVNASNRDFGLQNRIVWSERVMVALPGDHDLSARERLYWTDLRTERFIISRQDPGSDLAAMLTARLGEPGYAPDVEIHNVTRDNVLNMVSTGRFLSIATESVIGRGMPGVIFKALCEGGSQASRLEYGCYWGRENPNPVLHRLLQIITERYSG